MFGKNCEIEEKLFMKKCATKFRVRVHKVNWFMVMGFKENPSRVLNVLNEEASTNIAVSERGGTNFRTRM